MCHSWVIEDAVTQISKSLDPDQDRQNLQSRSGSKQFDTLIVFLKDIFFKKVHFEKKSADDNKKHEKIPRMQRVKNLTDENYQTLMPCGISSGTILFVIVFNLQVLCQARGKIKH